MRRLATVAAALAATAVLPAAASAAPVVPECDGGQVCQAEHADLLGPAVVATKQLQFSGSGYVKELTKPQAGLTYRVATGGGPRTVSVRYSNGDVPNEDDDSAGPTPATVRPLGVYVNGVRRGELSLAPTESQNAWAVASATVPLPKGRPKVSVRCESSTEDGCPVQLDYVAVTLPRAPVPAPASRCKQQGENGEIRGTYGEAAAIGWEGDKDGVVTCLGGSMYIRDGIDDTFGFGIAGRAAVSSSTWQNSGGWLPALRTRFSSGGLGVSITNFADRVRIGGRAYVVAYSRVRIANRTARARSVDPEADPRLVNLNPRSNRIASGATATHDYAIVADRFGRAIPRPRAAALRRAGGYSTHFAHMQRFWTARLAKLAMLDLPDRKLEDAYRSGIVNNLIVKDGDVLHVGENGYDNVFSHDSIGILTTQFTTGDFKDAAVLLTDLRNAVGDQPQYADGPWKYAWTWAVYAQKTGDIDLVRKNFRARGPKGATQPSIYDTAHKIAADRTGPGGIMGSTNDIDSDGLWTIDNYSALMGLASYRYLAARVGDTGEAAWAQAEYTKLLDAFNTALAANPAPILSCSVTEPNTANRCKDPRDANWAAPFLFGRWAWDGFLLGARQEGPAIDRIDATYDYGFGRIGSTLPANIFGGYPGARSGTAYNAGYGAGAMRGTKYRDLAVRAYQAMIQRNQSGPYSWWESNSADVYGSPWRGLHPGFGNGSSPHAWGISTANKALLDAVAAQKADGTLIVGRGIPRAWLARDGVISATRVPTLNGGRATMKITTRGGSSRVTVSGSVKASATIPAGQTSVEIPPQR